MTRGSVSARIQELKTKVMELSPETMLMEGAEMSRLTTLRLGGPADLLAEPCNVDGLQTLLRESSRLEQPVTLIGRGRAGHSAGGALSRHDRDRTAHDRSGGHLHERGGERGGGE